MGALRLLDRLVDAAVRGAAFLVLPVSLLLFLQWPLRDLVHLYSREANDLAQVLFALYVSVAITQATRRGASSSRGCGAIPPATTPIDSPDGATPVRTVLTPHPKESTSGTGERRTRGPHRAN